MTTLLQLVARGDIDAALDAAADLHPAAVHRALFPAGADTAHPGRAAEFLARWFTALPSAYLQADAAELFASCYHYQLRTVEDAALIGAHMTTIAYQQLLAHLSTRLTGVDFAQFAERDGGPLPDAVVNIWQTNGRFFRSLDTPTFFS